MYKSEERDTDDDYMYKFRTKLCTKKRCRNPPKCFNAHSVVLRRRVPTQGEDGLFNYIPEPCPQWKKLERCSMGESCPRSHGWLEIIFHPLLYKTKLCKVDLKKGVCRGYGIYCAKAHDPKEIRNLVKIYGKNWKRHYDLSLRTKAGSSPIVKAQGSSVKKSDTTQSMRRLIGNFFTDTSPDWPNGHCSDQAEALGSTKTSPMLTNSTTFIDPQSPLLVTSPPLFGDYNSVCDSISDLTLDGEITSYAQLYSEKVVMDEKSYTSPIPKVSWDCTWHSPGTDVHTLDSSSTSSCNSTFMSPFGENRKKCYSSDVYSKIDVSEWDKENQPTGIHEDNAESLFAQPQYGGNWNKNYF